MSPFVRKVLTASGDPVKLFVLGHDLQVGIRPVRIDHGQSSQGLFPVLRDPAFVEAGKTKLRDAGQGTLDFGTADTPRLASAVVKSSRSGILIDTIRRVYTRLGFDILDDEVFFQLVAARLVEPASKSDSVRELDELGVDVVHRNTFLRASGWTGHQLRPRDFRAGRERAA